jgi:phosphoglucosamine mutase
LINVKVNAPVDLASSKVIQSAVRDVEEKMGKRGRVLLRPSGTEPLIRVMVEGEDSTEVEQVANHLAQVVEQEYATG